MPSFEAKAYGIALNICVGRGLGISTRNNSIMRLARLYRGRSGKGTFSTTDRLLSDSHARSFRRLMPSECAFF